MKLQEKRRLIRRLQDFQISILVNLMYTWKHEGSAEAERGFLMAKSALNDLYSQLPRESMERIYIEGLISSILDSTESLAKFMVKLEGKIEAMPTDDPAGADSLPE